MALLVELPFPDIIIEDELHFLRCCPRYEHLRAGLSPNIKTILWNDDLIGDMFHIENIREISEYIHNITKLRFPKNKKLYY